MNGSNNVYQIFPDTSDPIGFAVYCELGSDGSRWTVGIRRLSYAIHEKFEDTIGVIRRRKSKIPKG